MALHYTIFLEESRLVGQVKITILFSSRCSYWHFVFKQLYFFLNSLFQNGIIPKTPSNDRYKTPLFPFFFIKIYSYSAHYTKKFCFEKEKYISFYLSII